MPKSRPQIAQMPAGTALLSKAMDVLDAVSKNSGKLDSGELSRRTGIPRPTLYRILAALAARGLVRGDKSQHTWAIGYQLLDMAQRIWSSPDLTAVATSELHRLGHITGETAYLAVMERGGVLSIGRFEGAHSQRSSSRLGTLKPLHCTSQGKALLAFMPEEQRRALLSRPLEPITPKTIIDPEQLALDLRLTRIRGYAIDDEEIVLGTRCVGAPIFDSSGSVIAAISIAGPSFRMTLERIDSLGREVQEAAQQIASQLARATPGADSASRFSPLAGYSAFDGINPVWNSTAGTLLWADRHAAAIVEYEVATGICKLRHRLTCPSGTFAFSPAHGLITFLGNIGNCERSGSQFELPGAPIATHRATDGSVAIISKSESCESYELGILTVAGDYRRVTQLSFAATAIAGVPAEDAFFLASQDNGLIYRFDVREMRNRVFARIPRAAGSTAGMAVAPDNRLWLALRNGWSVVRLDDVGDIAQSVPLPVPEPTGICFGGENMSEMFVTTTRYGLNQSGLENAWLSGRTLRLDPNT